MSHIAKLFMNGRSQAVRLPAAFRFEEKEVFIHQDPKTGDVILSRKSQNWDKFMDILQSTKVPDDFLAPREGAKDIERPDPFEGWEE